MASSMSGLLAARCSSGPSSRSNESIRDFKVARLDGRVVGCGSLHIMGLDIAEVRSLAVDEAAQGQGAGAAIVAAWRR